MFIYLFKKKNLAIKKDFIKKLAFKVKIKS